MKSIDELEALMEEELDKDYTNIESWKPEVGDKIMGVIVDKGVSQIAGGTGTPFILVMTKDEKMYRVFCTTVIEQALQRQKAEIGDFVGIKRIETPLGKRYKNFVVRVKKPKEISAEEFPPPEEEEVVQPKKSVKKSSGVQHIEV